MRSTTLARRRVLRRATVLEERNRLRAQLSRRARRGIAVVHRSSGWLLRDTTAFVAPATAQVGEHGQHAPVRGGWGGGGRRGGGGGGGGGGGVFWWGWGWWFCFSAGAPWVTTSRRAMP